jgi:hypothetical protein
MHESQQIAKLIIEKMRENETLKRKTPKKWLKIRGKLKKEARKAAGKGGKDIIPNIFQ